MQHMQSTNYQDNIVPDTMTSFNLMNQIHLSQQYYQYQQQQDQSCLYSLDFMLPPTTTAIYEPTIMMLYADLPMVLDNMPNSKLQMINDGDGNYDSTMQNSYHISPSFTVVPPITTMESTTTTCFFQQEQQQQELQKNLVKDVFFSPAMIESSCSSQQSDDCHSLVSDTTTLSCGSPSYQYEATEEEDQITAGANVYNSSRDDQVLFFYGLDLAAASTTEEEKKDTKIGGLGTNASKNTTSSTSSLPQLAIAVGNYHRRTKQQSSATTKKRSSACLNDRSSSNIKKKKNKKNIEICNNEITKLLFMSSSKKSTRDRKSSSNNEDMSSSGSCCSDAATSAWWGHKRSDNKKNDSCSKTASATEKKELSAMTLMPNNKSRFISSPSIYQKLSKQNIDWCRYCGTTEGVNWRPGPWGKRTLCNKHGCDYKGYGFACKLPRLDLTSFTSETIDKRSRPVLQLFCSHCQCQESYEENQLVLCDGCPKAFHQNCYHRHVLDNTFLKSNTPFYCSDECQDNLKRKRVVVELPRKRLPLMRTPKNVTIVNSSTETTRSSLREI